MKPIKCTVLLLAVLVVFSGTVEAEVTRKVDPSLLRKIRKKLERDHRGNNDRRDNNDRRNNNDRRDNNDRRNNNDRREKEQREQKERAQREKAEKAAQEEQKKQAEARKKRIAARETVEREQRDKANEARQKKVQDELIAEKTAREEKVLLGEYDTMAREVRMSSTQRSKLVEMIRKFRGLPPGTSLDNSGEIARLTKAYEAATGEKKKIIGAKLKAAQKKNETPPKSSKKTSKTSTTSEADLHKQIMGLLTPAQKLKWGGYKLAQDPLLEFAGVTLTDKQIKRIRVICDEAARDLTDEADVAPKFPVTTRQTVLKRVRMQIKYEVMTPEQRAVAK